MCTVQPHFNVTRPAGNISSGEKGSLQTVCYTEQRQSGRFLCSRLVALNDSKTDNICRNRYRPIQPKPTGTLQAANENNSKCATIAITNELQCFENKNSNYLRMTSKLDVTDGGSTSEPSTSRLMALPSDGNSLHKNLDQGRNYCCTICCKYNITLDELGQHVMCDGPSTQASSSIVGAVLPEIPPSLGKKETNKYFCNICKEESITVEEWPRHLHCSKLEQEAPRGDSDQPCTKDSHIKCISSAEETAYSCIACKLDGISVEDLPRHISLKCTSTNHGNVDQVPVPGDYDDMDHPTIRHENKKDIKLLHINCYSKTVDNLKVVNYSCTVCNVNNMTINQMFDHISCKPAAMAKISALLEDLFACSHCGSTYKSKVSLINHMVMHSQTETFHCNFCDQSFHLKSSLKKHLLTQHDKVLKIFKCYTCSESFPSQQTLKEHKSQHHRTKLKDSDLDDSKGHLCSMCGKSFTTRSNLKSHEVRMHNTKPKKHICEVCGRGFDHAVRLRLHLMKHAGTKNVICEVCGRRFYQNSELYKHMTCHSQERPFVCKLCDGTFKRRCNLMTHEAMMHGVVPEGYKSHLCPVCGKTFLIAKLLADHMESHSAEKFHCSKCGQEFVDKRSYTCHVKNDCKSTPYKKKARNKNPQPRKSPEGRSYQCKVCGKIFKASSNLGQHVRKVHEKDKYDKFCCTICGKLFKWKVCLDEHVRIHLNLKPCICKVCNKPFRTWSSLARHKKVHEEFRAYQCQLCGKAFRQTGHLRVHMKIHSSGVKPHPCGLCERSFLYNNEKIKHQNKMHNIISKV